MFEFIVILLIFGICGFLNFVDFRSNLVFVICGVVRYLLD